MRETKTNKERDMARRERTLEKYLLMQVNKIEGAECYKFSSENGLPDRVVLYGGLTFYIEMKTEVGSLSKLQKYFKTKIQGTGNNYIVLNSMKSVDIFIANLLM